MEPKPKNHTKVKMDPNSRLRTRPLRDLNVTRGASYTDFPRNTAGKLIRGRDPDSDVASF